MNKPKVLLMGGMPRPSGGVTVFLGRLVAQIGSNIDFYVLDIHQGEKDPNKAIKHCIAPRNKWLRMFWLVLHISIFKGDIVHFNFSSCRSLVAIALLPKFGRRFFLTLHNGEQLKNQAQLGFLARYFVRLGIKKIDICFALCDNHEQFYTSQAVPLEKTVCTKSQIPPVSVKRSLLDSAHANLRSSCDYILVSSGHLSRSYNFEYLIKYINDNANVGGLLFLYGEMEDAEYLQELKDGLDDPSKLQVYIHQSEKSFLEALLASDIYIRPTFVDSWGMAVADSLFLGVPAVASDVCDRAEGAVLCDPSNYERFVALVKQTLNESCTLKDISVRDCSLDFYNAYIHAIIVK